jgi:hypothetical protein
MDPRDEELLDKQMRRLVPTPRNDGLLALAIAAVFLVGLTLGGVVAGHKAEPLRTAANDTPISLFGHAPIARQ